MAYLTEYSFKQLIAMSEIKDLGRIDLQFFLTNIYNNQYLFYFFNQFDLKKIFREKVILSNDKTYVITYKEVPERIDNLNYVLKIKGKVKYHNWLECDALNRGFKNFNMPDPVVRLESEEKEKHKTLVNEVRNWFKINNFTVDRFEKGEISNIILTNLFNQVFPDKYNINPIFISQSDKEENQFIWYASKKTDNVNIKLSFDYNQFLKNTNVLIEQRRILCNSRTMLNLAKYDYLSDKNEAEIINVITTRIKEGNLKEVSEAFITNYGLKNLIIFWKKHKELKYKAYSEVSEFFKWTYNFKEKEFDKIYLESFNLESCSLCINKTIIASSQYPEI